MVRLIVLLSISSFAFTSESPEASSPKDPMIETQHDVSEAPGHNNHWEGDFARLTMDDRNVSRHSLAHYRIDADPMPAADSADSAAGVVASIVIQLPSFDSLPDDNNPNTASPK